MTGERPPPRARPPHHRLPVREELRFTEDHTSGLAISARTSHALPLHMPHIASLNVYIRPVLWPEAAPLLPRSGRAACSPREEGSACASLSNSASGSGCACTSIWMATV